MNKYDDMEHSPNCFSSLKLYFLLFFKENDFLSIKIKEDEDNFLSLLKKGKSSSSTFLTRTILSEVIVVRVVSRDILVFVHCFNINLSFFKRLSMAFSLSDLENHNDIIRVYFKTQCIHNAL